MKLFKRYSVKSFLLIPLVVSALFSQETGAQLLVITPDAFYDAVLPLAQWKVKKGITTKVVKTSQTGASATAIKSYIQNAYNNWPTRPKYLLLVGGPDIIPFQTVNGVYSDNYYTNMDADVFNEIISGRITATNVTQVQTVVNKILLYERAPYTTDTTWFLKGTTIVNIDNDPYDDSVYWSDARYVKQLMLNAGYITVDTLSDQYGDNANTVVQRVNDGRSFVLYRGQGVGQWYAPFAVDANQLANGAKMPILVSATCRTIGVSGGPAQVEMWFLTGTPTSPKGAVGYFATTTVRTGASVYRSAIAKNFFGAVFSGVNTFGDACEQARLKLYNLYPGDQDYYGFQCIGDPTMKIWTGVPKRLTVSYDSVLTLGLQHTVNIFVTHNSQPVESAYVCLMQDTLIYLTGYTGREGEVSFTVIPASMTPIDVTITGRNLHPYEGNIQVIMGGVPYLTYSRNEYDELGNGNGILEPGESFLLWTWVRNLGEADAHNVYGVLSSSNSFAFVSDSSAPFGEIVTGDSACNLKPYVISISPQISEPNVTFSLAVSDSLGHLWTYNFSVPVSLFCSGETGRDQYGYYMYDNTDTLSGNAPSFQWLEISQGLGTTISRVTNADADTQTISLPFTFRFYGINYNSIGVCSNGFVEMGTPTHRFGSNSSIPAVGGPKRLVSPFWDDLDPSAYGDVYQYFDQTNHRFIVEFYQCAHNGASNIRETFQIVFLDPQYYPTPTGDGEILFLYLTVSDASSCTVGIEDETETRGLQYLYNGSYDPNAAPLASGRAILITTKVPVRLTSPWVELSSWNFDDSYGGNGNGKVEPGETVLLTVALTNRGGTAISGLSAVLRSTDPYVTIIDSTSDFGNLPVGVQVDNVSNPYVLQVDPSAGEGYTGLLLNMTGNQGNYHGFGYVNMEIVLQTGLVENSLLRTQVSMYPNPFQGHFHILVRSPVKEELVKVRVYDITGRQLRALDEKIAGTRVITWDGLDQNGNRMPSGIYFIKVETDDFKKVQKVIKVR